MEDIWDQISIQIQGVNFSLNNTEKEKRVIIQYVMLKEQRELLNRFKEKGLEVNIGNKEIQVVQTNGALSDEKISRLLKKVLEIIGKFISKFDVRKEEVGQWAPPHSSYDGEEMSGAQAPRLPNDRRAQAPVAYRDRNQFFDPEPGSVCIFTVQKKHKAFNKKWLIPVGIGIATALAAPVVIPAAVGALGFGSGGIVGGSFAASMMSAAAIANGGGVAAGGLIATLQSIGATGAISATTALISGTTASAVSGVVVAATSKDDNK